MPLASRQTIRPSLPNPSSRKILCPGAGGAHQRAVSCLDALEIFREAAPEEIRTGIDRLLGQRQSLLEHFAPHRLDSVGGLKTRYHGNYHLGQVLRVQNDFFITDIEGDPNRPLALRRLKHSPLLDVASMLCCFSYVSAMATNRATAERPHDRHRLGPLVQHWEAETTAAFLAGYYGVTEQSRTFTSDMASTVALIEFFTFEKTLDELCHEMEQRPDWLSIPLFSLLRRLDDQ